MNRLIKHFVATTSNCEVWNPNTEEYVKVCFPATLVAIKTGNQVRIGSSVCKLTEGDVYSKKKGVKWATMRAARLATDEKDRGVQQNICNDDFQEFVNRCLRYFKDVPYANYYW